jgi:hypothetical protein
MADQLKPLPPRMIKKLAAALDSAECALSAVWLSDHGTFAFSPDSLSYERWCILSHRFHKLKGAYTTAVGDRNRAARARARNRKTPPKSRDKFALEDRMHEAADRLDVIEAMRPDFATARELIDANASFLLADSLLDIAQEHYQNAASLRRRQNRADAASNIVRVSHRRKSHEVHL